MKEIIKKGQIYFEYNGLTFNVCQIYEKRVDDSYIFTFEPNYKVKDIIPPSANFEGIQGLNLNLKQNIYERTGIPTFVSERIPPKNREELYMILEKNNLIPVIMYHSCLSVRLRQHKQPRNRFFR